MQTITKNVNLFYRSCVCMMLKLMLFRIRAIFSKKQYIIYKSLFLRVYVYSVGKRIRGCRNNFQVLEIKKKLDTFCF